MFRSFAIVCISAAVGAARREASRGIRPASAASPATRSSSLASASSALLTWLLTTRALSSYDFTKPSSALFCLVCDHFALTPPIPPKAKDGPIVERSTSRYSSLASLLAGLTSRPAAPRSIACCPSSATLSSSITAPILLTGLRASSPAIV